MEQNRTSDRRRFFRIDDSVNLSYQVLSDDELKQRLERVDNELESDFTVMSSLATISQQMSGIMHKIEAFEPEIAAYLKALDKKVDVLGRAFLLQSSNIAEQPTSEINLSASGVAFRTNQRLTAGSKLELKILLFPSFTGLMTFAEVVGCDELEQAEEGFTHAVRCHFIHLRENEQDVIIRHVIQKQSDQLRQRREAREIEG